MAGASQTEPFGESLSTYGALKDFGVDEKYIKLAEAISGKPQEIDPAMLAFLYFSKMGELASKPGATLFGSASGAAISPAEYMMKIKEQNRKAEASVPGTAINLMKALKPSSAGTTTLNSYTLQKDIKGIGVKGDTVTLTNANAAKIINADPGALLEYTKTTAKNPTKPYTVEILDETAFATAFPGLTLSEDKKIDLTNKQVALLPPGTFSIEDTTKASTGSTTVGVKPENLVALQNLLNLPELALDENNNALIPNSALLAATSAGLIMPKHSEAKQGVEKYLQQDRVLYMNEADAKKKLATFGVNEDDPEYQGLIDLMTTDDENLIGRPVIQADSYISFYVPRAGEDSEFNVITRTPGGSPVPAEVLARNEEIKALTKISIKQKQVMRELLPTLDSAMTTLLQNPNITGAFQEKTMGIRNFLSSAFGFTDNELADQKLLEAISNKLAPQMRPVGSGSTSDMEFKAYKSAILSMDNPGKANYLTLYSLDKTTRNAAKELQLTRELLNQNKSLEYIASKIAELDPGIYEKFDGIGAVDENGDLKYNTADEYIEARNAWKNSLPNGTVILNKDKNGDKIFPNAGTFIIKGWRRQ